MKFDLTLFLTLLFGLVLLIGFYGLLHMHEEVHVRIYRSYGIESRIEYFSHFPDFVTIAEEPCPNKECILANNINDVVGYHSFAFYFMIGFGFLCLIIIGGKDK